MSDTKPQEKFKTFESSRRMFKVITTSGKVATFQNFKFITKDEDIIQYITDEIANGGLKGITVGKDVDYAVEDPMRDLRKKFIEEYLAEQAALQDPTRNFDSAEEKVSAAKAKIASSATVAAVSGSSNSGSGSK